MENFLARCSVLAIIGGGFVATGDLSNVVSRGRHLIEAVDVPAAPDDQAAKPQDMATDTVPERGATPVPTPAVSAAPADRGSGHRPVSAPPAEATDDGRRPVDHRPPTNGPDRIDMAGLRAGDRITIWLRTAAIVAPERLVCDVIDPAAGEVLLHGGMAGPAARGTIHVAASGPDGSLIRGAQIRVHRIGTVAAVPADVLAAGTIVALARDDSVCLNPGPD